MDNEVTTPKKIKNEVPFSSRAKAMLYRAKRRRGIWNFLGFGVFPGRGAGTRVGGILRPTIGIIGV